MTISKKRLEEAEQAFRYWPGVSRYPTRDECHHVASVVDAVRGGNKKNRSSRQGRTTPPLLTTGRAFLRHLNKDLHQAKGQLPEDIPGEIAGALIDQHYPDIRAMEAVQNNLTALLSLYSARRPTNAAQFICMAVMRTWQVVIDRSSLVGERNVKVSKSIKPDGPLCGAVTALLASAGVNYSRDTISEMLRDRTRRPRSGGRKTTRNMPT